MGKTNLFGKNIVNEKNLEKIYGIKFVQSNTFSIA